VYKARYLPIALDDLKSIIRYIAHELEAPGAAEKLILKIDKEVKKIEDNPFRCHSFLSPEKLKYEYRILNVNNYSLFYVLEKEKIEIHRVIYSKRNILPLLKEHEESN